MGFEGGELSFEPDQRGADQRLFHFERRLVRQIAGREIVTAIDDKVIIREQRFSIVGSQSGAVFDHVHIRVQLFDPLGRGPHFGLPDFVGGMDDLALQVRQVDHVMIDDA